MPETHRSPLLTHICIAHHEMDSADTQQHRSSSAHYTTTDSTYVNSIDDNDTFDKCIIMPYTVTGHEKERRHRKRQRYAAGKLLFDAALRQKRTSMRGGVAG